MTKTYRLKEDARYAIPTEEAIKHKDLLINCDILLEDAIDIANSTKEIQAVLGIAHQYTNNLDGHLLFEGNFNAGIIPEGGEEHQFILKYYQHVKTWRS